MAEYDLGTARGEVVIGSDTSGLGDAEKALGGVEKKAGSSGKAIGKAGTIALVAGGAIAAGLGLAVKSAADFEVQLSAIKAVSGNTAAEMELVRQKALQIGKDTAFSASDAAGAMEELAKAGVATKDILNGAADATVALAAAGGVDLPFAAGIASNAMNQFSLKAKDLVGVADTIAGAANASAIDVKEFGYSLSQVGAVANLAGLSFADTAVAIAELGNAGIKGSDAGTSLKSFLSNLQPTTKKTSNLMKELGIVTKDGTNRFYDQAGRLKSLDRVQQILQNSLKGMTKQQKQATLRTLFGSDAIRAAAILAKNGAKGYDSLNKAIKKTSAADVAKTRMDNFAGSLEQLKGSVETLGIQLGTVLLPAVRQVVDFVASGVNAFIGLSDGMKKGIVIAASIAAGLLLIVGGALKLVQGIIAVNAAFTFLAANPVVAIIIGVTLAVVALVAGLIYAYKNFTTFRMIVDTAIKGVVTAFNWLLAQAKIVWPYIQAAIAAFVQWFMTTAWPIIKTVIGYIIGYYTTLWNIAKVVFAGILAAVQTFITWFMGSALPVIKTVVGYIVGFFQTLFRIARIIFVGVSKVVAIWFNDLKTKFNLVKGVVTAVIGFFGKLIGGVKEKIQPVIDFVGGIGGKILTAIGDLGSLLIETGKQVIAGLVSGITGAVGDLLSTVGSIGQSVLGAFEGAFDIGSPSKKAKKIGLFVMEGLSIGLKSGGKLAETEVAHIANQIAAMFKGKKTQAAVKKAVVGIIDSASVALNKQQLKLTGLQASLKTAKSQLLDAQKAQQDYAKSVADGVRAAGSFVNLWNAQAQGGNVPTVAAFKAQLDQMTADATAFLDNVTKLKSRGVNGDLLQQLVEQGYGDAGQVAAMLANSTDEELKGILASQAKLDTIAKKTGSFAAKSFMSVGVATAQGIVDGLDSQVKAMEKSIANLVKKLVAAVKKELKIKSPSKVTAYLGKMTGVGFIEGIEDQLGRLKKVAAMTADASLSPLESRSATAGRSGSFIAPATTTGTEPRQLHVEVNTYNPVAEATSITVKNQMTRLSALGVV